MRPVESYGPGELLDELLEENALPHTPPPIPDSISEATTIENQVCKVWSNNVCFFFKGPIRKF